MPCGEPKEGGGEPCQQPVGWGTDRDEGPCKYHLDDAPSASSGRSDRQRERVEADGRPYGELQINRILEALRDGATYEIAARAAGVAPRTFRRWRRRYDDLRERVQRAEAESATQTLSRLQEAAKNGDTATMRWLLEKRHGYGTSNDELPEEEARQFVEAVQAAITEVLPAEKVNEVMEQIDENLERVRHA